MTQDLEASRSATWRLFLTAYTMLIEQIEQELSQSGLPPLSWYDVLWSLEEAANHRLRLYELADSLVLHRSNLTRLVDRLEQAGLVRRESCSTDRRGAFAAITEQGLTMRQQMWEVYSLAIVKHFSEYLNDEEIEVISQALMRIVTHLRKPEI